MRPLLTRRSLCVALTATLAGMASPVQADLPATIAKLKASVLPVGYFKATDSPRFTLAGSGFVVGDGTLLVTNQHVVDAPGKNDAEALLMVQLRTPGGPQMRRATLVDGDRLHDLALLRLEGAPLAALPVGDSDAVREGQSVAFVGFPIGGALGFTPVTHRGTISSIAPVVLPGATAGQLNAQAIQRLREGPFDIFQLDATAYPGNSGGPLFDPETGEVLGVVNMGLVKGSRESALSHPSGISYAIPAKFVRLLMQRSPPR